jgi:hypothetical protein
MIRGIEGKRIFRDTQDRKDPVTRLEDLSKQTGNRILAWSLLGWVRAKIAWILSRKYGVALAEISRKLGVCTSAIAKAIRKKEGEDWADF